MRLFPMFSDVRDRNVLVVGGGAIAWRKTILLLEAQACVHVGAPALCEPLSALAGRGAVHHLQGLYRDQWLDGQCLVVAATGLRLVNAEVARDAARRNLWVNVVDDPDLSSFHVPAIVDRSPLIVAVSSTGTAPVLARRLREKLEGLLDPALAELAELARQYRSRIRARYPDADERRRFYDWMCEGPVASRLAWAGQGGTLGGRLEDARRCLENGLCHGPQAQGIVCFVDVGPGDPDLLTLRGLRELGAADMVLHEPLPDSAVLGLARRDADRQALGEPLPVIDAPPLQEALARVRAGARVAYLFSGRRGAPRALQEALRERGYCCWWIPGVGNSPIADSQGALMPSRVAKQVVRA